MQTLLSVLNETLFLFLCMLIGFVLNKARILPDNASSAISRLLTYVFMPALTFSSFYAHFTVDNLRSYGNLLLYGVGFLAFSILLALLLGPLFTKDKAELGIYRYSIVIANIGYMGNSIVLGLFGEEKLCLYLVFCIPLNFFIFSVGLVWLTGGKFTWRSLLNPAFIGMFLGIILGLTRCPLPAFGVKLVDSCKACFSPVAMILSGFVVARYRFKDLLTQKKVYFLSLLRLVAIPLAVVGICRLIGTERDVTVLVTVAAAMPLGLNTIVFPAAYGGNDKPGAAMALISNILGILTIPLILYLVL